MNIEPLLSYFTGVKRIKEDQYKAVCPAHDDHDPSLSITNLSDGRILIHCWAGCDSLSVLHSVGLEMGDLFPDNGLGENLRGLAPWITSGRKKARSQNTHCQTVLNIAASDRAKGKRLSVKDLQAEREAWLQLNKRVNQ